MGKLAISGWTLICWIYMQPMPLSNFFSLPSSAAAGLAVYAVAIAILLAVLLFLIRVLGQKVSSHNKGTAYECGVSPTGSARFQYPVPFYLIAVFFLIFDLEAAFIFAWAVSAKELGITGYIEICTFIGVLFLSLVYIWVKGGLDWRRYL